MPPHPVQEERRALLVERDRLVTQRHATRQKQQQAASQRAETGTLEPLWVAQVTQYPDQIATIEHRILACLKSQPQLHHRYQQITAIPGIGLCFGTLWVSLFGDQPTLKPKHIASRFGHAPHERVSGTSRRTAPTSTGPGEALFRKFATLAARSAQQWWSKMAAYKVKKRGEGNPQALITNNVMNRLIRIICAIWNADSTFDPEHQSPFAT